MVWMQTWTHVLLVQIEVCPNCLKRLSVDNKSCKEAVCLIETWQELDIRGNIISLEIVHREKNTHKKKNNMSLEENQRLSMIRSGLGNLGNMQSKLSLKCTTMLEIDRLANRGSYPTSASRFWTIEIWLLVYHFGLFLLIRSIFFQMHSDQGVRS